MKWKFYEFLIENLMTGYDWNENKSVKFNWLIIKILNLIDGL